MPIITDLFNRGNESPIGAPWTLFTAGTVGIQLLNRGFAPAGSGSLAQTGAALYLSGGAFLNDQYAEATIKSIAPPLATLTISAALQAAGNTTYTYVLTSGTPVFSGMDIVIAGMQNAGNDGDFVVASILGSTFTVANASGVTESGSVGSGTASSDSLCGLMVRGTADGKNGYFLLIGTNSGEVAGAEDSRAYTVELWVLVNGVSTLVQFIDPPPRTVIDSPGDVYRLSATGTEIKLTKNGIVVPGGFDVTDIHGQIGGYPGIYAQSLSNATPTVGNAGTIWTDWTGSDTFAQPTSGWVAQAADAFSGSGNLNNPPWQQTPYSPSVIPTVDASGACTSSNIADNATAEYTGRTWANDQASECTLLSMSGGAGFVMCTVRNNAPGSASLNNYALYCATSTGIGTSGTWNIFKYVAGTPTSIASGVVALFSVGDVFTLRIQGSSLTALQNGTTLGTVSDSAFASGSPGFLINTSHISRWTGYEYISLPTLPPPTFNPPAGTYRGNLRIQLSANPGATVYYTTDGTTPTSGSLSVPAGQNITITSSSTVKAYASQSGFNDSGVQTEAYTILTALPSHGGGGECGMFFPFG